MPDLATEPFNNSTMYWFAKLERAVESGDFEGALRAQRELKRLGVRVEYLRGLKPREAAHASR